MILKKFLWNNLILFLYCAAALTGCDRSSVSPDKMAGGETKLSIPEASSTQIKNESGILNVKDMGLELLKDKSAERLIADIDNDGTFDTIQFAKLNDIEKLTKSGVDISPFVWSDDTKSVFPQQNDTVMLVYPSGRAEKPKITQVSPFKSVAVLMPDAKFDAEYVLCWPIEAKTALYFSSENGSAVVYAVGDTFKAESCGA